MNLHELKIYAVMMVLDYPTLKEEIWDFVQLAIDEIEEGGSEEHECSLAQRDIEFIVNEMVIEKEMEKINSPGEDKTVHGYSNHETYLMVSHIHNNQEWLEESFELIRQTDNSHRLMIHFHDEIFKGRELKDIFGKLAFGNVNWNEIFDNLKEMMPKESYEELEERLALANIQAKRLFDLLYDLRTNCQGYGSLEEEMSRIHNIKLLTNVSTNEWKYQD